MHHSRLSSIIIDCKTNDFEAAAEFWSKALGKPLAPPEATEPGGNAYRELRTEDDEPIILLQQVDHPSRVHLDIESDDPDAEAARLEALGAKKIEWVRRWWVMEAPTGHRFCVLRKQRKEFGPHLNEWK